MASGSWNCNSESGGRMPLSESKDKGQGTGKVIQRNQNSTAIQAVAASNLMECVSQESRCLEGSGAPPGRIISTSPRPVGAVGSRERVALCKLFRKTFLKGVESNDQESYPR